MKDNCKKGKKDWERKVVLPEARKFIAPRYEFIMDQCEHSSDKYLT